jgi:hypothetical protein
MDFLERWFDVSPDGGSGSLELVYLVLGFTALVAWSFRRSIAARFRALRRGRRAP